MPVCVCVGLWFWEENVCYHASEFPNNLHGANSSTEYSPCSQVQRQYSASQWKQIFNIRPPFAWARIQEYETHQISFGISSCSRKHRSRRRIWEEWHIQTLLGICHVLQAHIQLNRKRTSRSLCDNEMWCACLSTKSFSACKAVLVLGKNGEVQCFYCVSFYPRHSMDDIFTYIWIIVLVYVGKYTIHWVSGCVLLVFFSPNLPP